MSAVDLVCRKKVLSFIRNIDFEQSGGLRREIFDAESGVLEAVGEIAEFDGVEATVEFCEVDEETAVFDEVGVEPGGLDVFPFGVCLSPGSLPLADSPRVADTENTVGLALG